MEPIPQPASEPSVLLLNEIEILLAQTRLVELYLKQAQASAAHDASMFYRQHQAEQARLSAELTETKRSVDDAAAQTADLAVRLKDKQHALDECAKELEAARGEIVALREQQSAMEQAQRAAEEEWHRAGLNQRELEGVLEAKNDHLARLQLEMTEMRDRLAGEIKTSEQRYQQEIAALRRKLDEQEARHSADAAAANAPPEHLGRLEAVAQTSGQHVVLVQFKTPRQRWHSRFAAKRRWNI